MNMQNNMFNPFNNNASMWSNFFGFAPTVEDGRKFMIDYVKMYERYAQMLKNAYTEIIKELTDTKSSRSSTLTL